MRKNIAKQQLRLELNESYCGAELLFMALIFQQQQKMISSLIDKRCQAQISLHRNAAQNRDGFFCRRQNPY
jgi:hypothetical protein